MGRSIRDFERSWKGFRGIPQGMMEIPWVRGRPGSMAFHANGVSADSPPRPVTMVGMRWGRRVNTLIGPRSLS